MVKPLYKYPLTKMTAEQTGLLTNIMTMESVGAEFGDEEAGAFFQILKKRLEFHGVPCNRYVILFLCALCKTPGELVLYAYAIACIYQKCAKEVGIHDVCFAFAVGFPNDEEMSNAWADQKSDGVNLLDQEETWSAENLMEAS